MKRALSRFRLPFDFRDSRRWSLASFFSLLERYLWFAYLAPSEVMTRSLMPTSRPTAAPVEGSCGISTSVQQRETKNFPLRVMETVAFRIRPCTVVDVLAFTQPSLGSLTAPSRTARPTFEVKLSRQWCFALNLGKPTALPLRAPLLDEKKFW